MIVTSDASVRAFDSRMSRVTRVSASVSRTVTLERAHCATGSVAAAGVAVANDQGPLPALFTARTRTRWAAPLARALTVSSGFRPGSL